MKNINELISCKYDVDIYGITDDSRNVKPGFLFVATKGFNVDHYDYIDSAIKNGCSFVVADRPLLIDFPHIVVDKNINDFYRDLCKRYYDLETDKLKLIGITGTDGKTTTATIIKNIIENCAYMGTNGLEIFDEKYYLNNTTPVISELYEGFKRIIDRNCLTLSMEVSSEALLHNRVDDFEYSIVGITNVTGDHLNIHKTFDNYVKSKLKLLSLVKSGGFIVLNGDDDVLKDINIVNCFKFGFNENNDYVICNYIEDGKYIKIHLKHDGEEFEIVSSLKGKYNVYNVVMAYVICRLYGINDDIIISRIKNLKLIEGRTEFLDFGQPYDLILDYAHTINAVKNILSSFQNYNKIIVVIGCAGGREKEKRSVIGKYVIENSDVSIFTMDDPRYENVDDIIDQMVGNSEEYIRIINREKAIRYALDIASKDDVVLVLGKGRDKYMAVEDKKISYSDYDVIKKYFGK